MISAVTAAARGTPFQAAQLIDHLRMFQQVNPSRIYQWEQVAIEIGLRRRALLVADVEFSELLDGPDPSEPIASYFAEVVTSQYGSEFSGNLFRRKGRFRFAQAINDAGKAPLFEGAEERLP